MAFLVGIGRCWTRRWLHSSRQAMCPRSPMCSSTWPSSAASRSVPVCSMSSAVINDIALSPEQVSSYRENGFLVIPDLLSPSQLAKWRDAVDDAVLQRGNSKFPSAEQDDATNVDFEYYDQVFTQRVNLWQTSPIVRQLLLEAGRVFGRLACELEGIQGTRIWHDQALIKEPFANPTSWHADVPYWSFNSVHAISLWVALDDATSHNGCMYFLPGSHKVLQQRFAQSNDIPEIKIGKNMVDLFKEFPELRTLNSVSAEMKAGSASFHNGMLAHGAGANMTAGRRRAMTVQMMPTGCTFNGKKNVLTDEQFDSLSIGDALENNEWNPLLFEQPSR